MCCGRHAPRLRRRRLRRAAPPAPAAASPTGRRFAVSCVRMLVHVAVAAGANGLPPQHSCPYGKPAGQPQVGFPKMCLPRQPALYGSKGGVVCFAAAVASGPAVARADTWGQGTAAAAGRPPTKTGLLTTLAEATEGVAFAAGRGGAKGVAKGRGGATRRERHEEALLSEQAKQNIANEAPRKQPQKACVPGFKSERNQSRAPARSAQHAERGHARTPRRVVGCLGSGRPRSGARAAARGIHVQPVGARTGPPRKQPPHSNAGLVLLQSTQVRARLRARRPARASACAPVRSGGGPSGARPPHTDVRRTEAIGNCALLQSGSFRIASAEGRCAGSSCISICCPGGGGGDAVGAAAACAE